MADPLEDGSSSNPDAKPATKADAKKDKHLQYVGIAVGLVALILTYVYLKNKSAAAAAGGTTTLPVAPPTDTGAGFTGGGGGGGTTIPDNSSDFALIEQELSALLNAPGIAGSANGGTPNITVNVPPGGGSTTPGASSTSTLTASGGSNPLSSSDVSGVVPGQPAVQPGGVPFNYVRIFQPSSGAYSGKSLYALGNPGEVQAARAAGYTVVGGKTIPGANAGANYAIPK